MVDICGVFQTGIDNSDNIPPMPPTFFIETSVMPVLSRGDTWAVLDMSGVTRGAHRLRLMIDAPTLYPLSYDQLDVYVPLLHTVRTSTTIAITVV